MIIPGKDLIILADGVPLAASRSCNIDVDAEIIKVSNPTDGSWRHIITGLKSWKVSTNHLLKSAQATDGFIEAVAVANNGVTTPAASYVRTSGGIGQSSGRGLTAWIIDQYSPYSPMSGVSQHVTFDTYGDSQSAAESAMSEMISWLENTYVSLNPMRSIAIFSNDAFGMNGTLRSAIEEYVYADLSMVPSERSRGALAIVGGWNLEKAVVQYVPPVNGAGGVAQAKMWLQNGEAVVDYTMKDMLLKVGTTLDLRIQVNGFPNDTLHGSAICRSCRITGTNGNLAQGAFSWEGTGPLV